MSLVTVVLTETVHARELPIDAWIYGLIALVIFAVLAMIVASYRDVANRHSTKSAAYAARHSGDEHGSH